jgi:hypothetical protein
MNPITVLPGDAGKPNPFTILIVANPALEAPWSSGTVIRDRIVSKKAEFDACVKYIVDALTQALPLCAEPLLNDPVIRGRTRILSLFDPTLPVSPRNAFVGLDSGSSLLIARRDEINAFIAAKGILADIVYAITAGDDLHDRASAWFTTDDAAAGGIAFNFDGNNLTHCYEAAIPGTIAMHAHTTGPTAAHEFCHAISSYSNGSIVDLYVDSLPGINNKRGRPIPGVFGSMNTMSYGSDPSRDHIGYDAGWQSYHSDLTDATRPALMDNYWHAADPLACQNDRITRNFIIDRLRAKTGRP